MILYSARRTQRQERRLPRKLLLLGLEQTDVVPCSHNASSSVSPAALVRFRAVVSQAARSDEYPQYDRFLAHWLRIEIWQSCHSGFSAAIYARGTPISQRGAEETSVPSMVSQCALCAAQNHRTCRAPHRQFDDNETGFRFPSQPALLAQRISALQQLDLVHGLSERSNRSRGIWCWGTDGPSARIALPGRQEHSHTRSKGGLMP